MVRIGILANPGRPGIGPVLDRVAALARRQGVVVRISADLDGVMHEATSQDFVAPTGLPRQCDVVIAIGGDGTILRAAGLVGAAGTPILGVNVGRLGFLAGAGPDEFEQGFARLRSGDYAVEDRMGLVSDAESGTVFALNEFVIEKGVTARMVQVRTWISGAPVSAFYGNGIIVATPTGSTGYNLSAGGPVLDPSMQAMIATPICPHSLSLRPVVVPPDRSVTVQVAAGHTDVMVTADGHTVCPLPLESRIVIRRAPFPTRLINLQGVSFYGLLRRKLDWNLDARGAQEA